MLLTPPGRDREREREPGLDGPGERGDHHVRPVRIERAQRRVQGPNAVLELVDEVLLVATMVCLGNDLLNRHGAVVRDVEQVAVERVEAALVALFVDELAHDDDAVGPFRPSRLVIELGDILRDQQEVPVPAFDHDLLFDPRLLLSRLGREDLIRTAFELGVLPIRQAFCALDERRVGVVSEHEAHTVDVPSVQVLGHREVGVATQEDVAEPSAAAQRDGLVEQLGRPFVGRPAAFPVEQKQRFLRVRQGDQQRVVAPHTLVRHVHPFLALAGRGQDGSIGVDPRCSAGERLRLLLPDTDSQVIDDVRQPPDRLLVEAPTVVPSRCRIWNGPRTQSVEEDCVVAANLDVIEDLSTTQQVVGDVQDVI